MEESKGGRSGANFLDQFQTSPTEKGGSDKGRKKQEKVKTDIIGKRRSKRSKTWC